MFEDTLYVEWNYELIPTYDSEPYYPEARAETDEDLSLKEADLDAATSGHSEWSRVVNKANLAV